MPDQNAIDTLSRALKGPLVLPEDDDFNSVRAVWNGMFDRRPAMIARCTGAADVITSVNFAREHNVQLAVRGGGHSVAGKSTCDDGLMIDLSLMNSVHIDPFKKTARVGPGARLGDLDHEAQAFGLVTTGGIVSTTGVAGLTLGGGLGYLARKYGLAMDNLLSCDIVTANGKLLRACETENADLFWALRGGGGNFGVVTSFEFKLHNFGPTVLTAQVFYPYDLARTATRTYRDVFIGAPDELSGFVLAVNVPPMEPFPAEYHGKTAIALIGCYAGEEEKGRQLLKPFSEVGTPILEAVAPMPYTDFQQNFNAGMPAGARYYWKSHYLHEISDNAIDTFVESCDPLPGPLTLAGFEPLGGAISRIAPDATAFGNRDANYAFGIWAGWTESSDDNGVIEWTRQLHRKMSPHSTGGAYLNYMSEDEDERVGATVGTNLQRLRRIKAKYDPDNLFCSNHNITPGA